MLQKKSNLEKRKELGLDLPIFYLGFSNKAEPDTLHHIAKRAHKDNLNRLINDYGNWDEISAYYHSLKDLEKRVFAVPRDSANAAPVISIKEDISAIYINHLDDFLTIRMNEIDEAIGQAESLNSLRDDFRKVKMNYAAMKEKPTRWKNWIPKMTWNGVKNQYHRWFFGDKPYFGSTDGDWTSAGFIRGDFGISYQDKRPVGSVLWDAIGWTVLISSLSILLTYLIAIPLGVRSAIKKGSLEDQSITTFLFVLYSLPSFWIATLAIIYLCGGDYLDWFPS